MENLQKERINLDIMWNLILMVSFTNAASAGKISKPEMLLMFTRSTYIRSMQLIRLYVLFISLCSINMSNNMIRLNRYYTIFKVYICNRSATPANTHLADLSLVLKLKVQIYVGPEIMTMDYLSIYFSIQTPLSCFVNRTFV